MTLSRQDSLASHAGACRRKGKHSLIRVVPELRQDEPRRGDVHHGHSDKHHQEMHELDSRAVLHACMAEFYI
jgi:hypothetical protein